MNDKSDKRYCTIDHANKQADGFDYNAHQFWLNLARRKTGRRDLDSATQASDDSVERVSDCAEVDSGQGTTGR